MSAMYSYAKTLYYLWALVFALALLPVVHAHEKSTAVDLRDDPIYVRQWFDCEHGGQYVPLDANYGAKCTCPDGWKGIDCSQCTTDNACGENTGRCWRVDGIPSAGIDAYNCSITSDNILNLLGADNPITILIECDLTQNGTNRCKSGVFQSYGLGKPYAQYIFNCTFADCALTSNEQTDSVVCHMNRCEYGPMTPLPMRFDLKNKDIFLKCEHREFAAGLPCTLSLGAFKIDLGCHGRTCVQVESPPPPIGPPEPVEEEPQPNEPTPVPSTPVPPNPPPFTSVPAAPSPAPINVSEPPVNPPVMNIPNSSVPDVAPEPTAANTTTPASPDSGNVTVTDTSESVATEVVVSIFAAIFALLVLVTITFVVIRVWRRRKLIGSPQDDKKYSRLQFENEEDDEEQDL